MELPALAIVGPRASGKTTTAMRHARTVIRLDRPAEAAVVAADPDTALDGLPEPVLLDEWQEVPELLGAVKRACDTQPRPGRFILTGSVRAEIEAKTWPGTGRVTRIAMYPMTVDEQLGTLTTPFIDRIAANAPTDVPGEPLNVRHYIDMALRGGFPQAALSLGPRARRGWLDTYTEEIVTRDVQMAGTGHDSVRLGRYFEAYALHSGGIVDDTTLYSAANINRQTALGYHELLSRIYVIDELPAWTSNRLKRLTLAPKRQLIDSSLLASIAGATQQTVMRDANLLGRLLETFVVAPTAGPGHRERAPLPPVPPPPTPRTPRNRRHRRTRRPAHHRHRNQSHRRAHNRRRPPPRLAARQHRQPIPNRSRAPQPAPAYSPSATASGQSPSAPCGAEEMPGWGGVKHYS